MDKKKKEKANALFAGIGGGDDDKESDDNSGDDKKKKKKKAKEETKVEQVMAPQQISSNNMIDLLDFNTSAPISMSSTNQGSGNLLDNDIFGSSSSVTQMRAFSPMTITTPQFGEMWMQHPLEAKTVITAPSIQSPQIYASTMNSKIGLHPVEIINNEVICAGSHLASQSLVLVHCRVNQGGYLEFTLKGSNQEVLNQVSTQVLPSALSSAQSLSLI